jgi:hypothetical protein
MSKVRLLVWGMIFSAYACAGHCPPPFQDVAPISTAADLSNRTPQGKIDLIPQRLARISPGTIIGDGPPPGWTHLVLFANPGLGAGDFQGVPKVIVDYARWLHFTLLAKVGKHKMGNRDVYYLERFARGFAVAIKDKNTIVEPDHTLDADLGFMGGQVLKDNEKVFESQVRQIIRTDTMLIFDATTYMLRNSEHQKMVNRYAVIVFPETGRLITLVWLLALDGPEKYKAAETTMQLLPANMHEKRLLSVKREKIKQILFVPFPDPDAFALMRIPQGQAVPFTPQLQRLAAINEFTTKDVQELETNLRAAVSAPH